MGFHFHCSSIITNQAGNSFPFRGCLPGITVAMNGIYDRVSDPTVWYTCDCIYYAEVVCSNGYEFGNRRLVTMQSTKFG